MASHFATLGQIIKVAQGYVCMYEKFPGGDDSTALED
jgi:hypothetical protein